MGKIQGICFVDFAVSVINSTASGIEVFRDLSVHFQYMESLLEHLRLSDERAPNVLRVLVQRLGYDLAPLESLPYYENPNVTRFERRNWEEHNIFSPNVLIDLRTLLLHAELLYLAEHAKQNKTDATTDARTKEIKNELLDIAGSGGYLD